MSDFDTRFAANADHLASNFGEATVVYVDPHDDEANTTAVPGCIVSDERTEREFDADGELKILKTRTFLFEVSGVAKSVLRGGKMIFEARIYFIDERNASTGGWMEVKGIFQGRQEMTKDSLKG